MLYQLVPSGFRKYTGKGTNLQERHTHKQRQTSLPVAKGTCHVSLQIVEGNVMHLRRVVRVAVEHNLLGKSSSCLCNTREGHKNRSNVQIATLITVYKNNKKTCQ